MKELSIEQKAKLYEEAIEKARIWKDKSGMPKDKQGILDDIFPELAEPEDERIVKELLTFFRESIHGGHILTNKEYDSWIAWLEKQGGQKPAWSEEDEKISKAIIKHINGESDCLSVDLSSAICWIKSLKDRVQLKQVWSEEDENTRKKIIKFLKEQNYFDGKANEFKEPYKKEYEWLKSLRPQSQWKPSEEQIEILDMVLTNEAMDDNIARILRELREQLKKLREE